MPIVTDPNINPEAQPLDPSAQVAQRQAVATTADEIELADLAARLLQAATHKARSLKPHLRPKRIARHINQGIADELKARRLLELRAQERRTLRLTSPAPGPKGVAHPVTITTTVADHHAAWVAEQAAANGCSKAAIYRYAVASLMGYENPADYTDTEPRPTEPTPLKLTPKERSALAATHDATSRNVAVSVSLPSALLDVVDAIATKRNAKRSATMARLLTTATAAIERGDVPQREIEALHKALGALL